MKFNYKLNLIIWKECASLTFKINNMKQTWLFFNLSDLIQSLHTDINSKKEHFISIPISTYYYYLCIIIINIIRSI